MAIDYDKSAAEYEASLVTKLRGHGAGSFLEHWVPDPNPALGIFNMIEAAWTDGREEFDLTVSRTTLGSEALRKLQEIAAPVADLELEEAPDSYSLTIRRASRVNGSKVAVRASGAPKVASRERQAAVVREVTWAIHPTLAAALESEASEIGHEGTAAADKDCVSIEGALEGGKVSLAVAHQTGLIKAARHYNVTPPVRRKLVELMCRLVEGKTVQDASDHAGTYAIHALHRRAGKRPSSEGILLPANAGIEVVAAVRQLRAACHEYLSKWGHGKTENFFELPPSVEWRHLPQETRLLRAVLATDAFCREENVPANSMKAVRVEKDIHGHEIRVIVQVSSQIPHDAVPSTLRRLERYLKTNVEPVLQVYLEPVKDLSVLRRL